MTQHPVCCRRSMEDRNSTVHGRGRHTLFTLSRLYRHDATENDGVILGIQRVYNVMAEIPNSNINTRLLHAADTCERCRETVKSCDTGRNMYREVSLIRGKIGRVGEIFTGETIGYGSTDSLSYDRLNK